jgi:hypothetical protein
MQEETARGRLFGQALVPGARQGKSRVPWRGSQGKDDLTFVELPQPPSLGGDRLRPGVALKQLFAQAIFHLHGLEGSDLEWLG